MAKPEPYVELKLSEYFRTISADNIQYWLDPEISRLMFSTDHYFSREKGVKDSIRISRDDILRELQLEVRVPSSLLIKIAVMILQTGKMRVECPVCQSLEADLNKHMEQHYPENVTTTEVKK